MRLLISVCFINSVTSVILLHVELRIGLVLLYQVSLCFGILFLHLMQEFIFLAMQFLLQLRLLFLELADLSVCVPAGAQARPEERADNERGNEHIWTCSKA